MSLYLHVPLALQLLAVGLSMLHVHRSELSLTPRALLLYATHLVLAAAAKALYLAALFLLGLGVPQLRFDLAWGVVINYALLLLLEAVVWIVTVRLNPE